MSHLQPDAHSPPHDPVVAPDENVLDVGLRHPPPLSQGVPVEVDKFEALDTKHQAGPVETVHQLQLHSEIFLSEVVQHPGGESNGVMFCGDSRPAQLQLTLRPPDIP